MESVEIHASIPDDAWVLLFAAVEGRFDVQIRDASERICVRMSGRACYQGK